MKISIIILFSLIVICSSKSADAWVPPTGCIADSWVLINNNSTIIIQYFNGNELVCGQQLISGGALIPWGGQGWSFDGSGKVDSNEMSTTVSFFAGLLSLSAFIFGVNGGKQS